MVSRETGQAVIGIDHWQEGISRGKRKWLSQLGLYIGQHGPAEVWSCNQEETGILAKEAFSLKHNRFVFFNLVVLNIA